MAEPNSNHEKNAEPQDAASEKHRPQETPQGGRLPDVSKTVRDVRTLWGSIVSPDASPGSSIKAGGIWAGLGAASKLLPRLRRLSKAKEEKEKPEESDFELIELLGKGGMGMVFLARQKSLDREVAVKVIQPKAAQDAEARGKFFAEALVTGELDHPNIVPVYDFGGTPEGVLFYPMKQVRGTSWDKVIKGKSLDDNLSVLLSVSDAVAFAHDKGVIHRDLKPENVMLGDYGEVYVMDWGLAASVGMEKAEKLTPETGFAGTPAYMAPEMARCEPTKIGPASDIYLLGGILYEIVTGLRPHTGDDVYSCIHAAMENVIQPTEKKGELVEIALKAMATGPEERYKSAKEFQRAIREFRSHAESLKLSAAAEERLSAVKEKPKTEVYRECTETIAGYQQAIELWSHNEAAILGLRKARETFVKVALERGDLALAQSQVTAIEEECRKFILPEKRLESPKALAEKVSLAVARAARKEKIARFTRRAALAAASLVLIVSLAAYFITKAQRNRALTAERRAIAARAKEAEQRKRAERENYYNIIALADAKAADLHFDQAEALLWTARADLRGWEWGRLMRVCHPELLTLFRTALVPSAKSVGTEVTCAAFSPDGARVVVGSSDGVASILDAKSGQVRLMLTGSDQDQAQCAAFSADGNRIATGGHDGTTVVWDAKSGQELATLVSAGEARVISVGLSPDGRRAFMTHLGGWAEVWDVESRHKIFTFHGRGPDEVAFSPDGTRLAGIQQLAYVRGGWKKGPDDTVKLWDALTGAEIATLERRSILSVAFSMNGRRLATEGYRRDPTTNAVVWEAKLWDALTGAEIATVPCGTPTPGVATLALSMDGKRIATRPNGGTTTVWDAQTGAQLATYQGHSPLLACLTFSPDGRRVLSKGLSGLQAEIWDAETGQEVLTLKGLSQVIGPLCVFSPNGKLVLTVGPNSVKLWDAQRGGEPLTVVGPSPAFSSAQLSADGKRVLTTHGDGLARLWDAETGAECLVLAVKVRRADFSPDLSLVVTRDADGTISVREAEAGREVRSLQVDSLRSVEADLEKYGQPAYAFSPDGKRIAAETKDESLDIWDAETRKVVLTIPDVGLRPWLAFSPDGRRLAAGGGQSSKQPMNVYLPGRIWDAQTGRQILTFGDGSHELGRIQFSPDGRRVAAWGGELEPLRMWLNLWESNTGRQILSTKDDAYIVVGFVFSPDGKRLVGTGGDEVRIWDTDTGELVLTLKGYRNELCFATFSPDGSRVITSSLNGVKGTMKVWDAQNGREMLTLNGLTASQFVGGFSRDGRRLLTQGADGSLRILEAFDWNITPEELEKEQRERYKRWLQQNGETVEAKDDSIHSLSPGRVAAALQSAGEASRRKASREPCRDNLKQIATAELTWAGDYDGRFSEKLSQLYPVYVASLDCFWCPSAGISKITDERLIDSQTNYVLRRGLTRASPPTDVLIYEQPSNHGGEGGHVLQVDGTIRWVSASELKDIAEKHSREAELSPAEPVQPGASKFTIPKENLEIPEGMQVCAENLRKIHQAMTRYQKEEGHFPDWLSHLVPDYLSAETLPCPNDPKHVSQYWPDPKLPCSYGYELSRTVLPTGWSAAGMECREWKVEEVKLFGDVVPIARCLHHGDSVLNLSTGGQIYTSALSWEPMFIAGYKPGDELRGQ